MAKLPPPLAPAIPTPVLDEQSGVEGIYEVATDHDEAMTALQIELADSQGKLAAANIALAALTVHEASLNARITELEGKVTDLQTRALDLIESMGRADKRFAERWDAREHAFANANALAQQGIASPLGAEGAPAMALPQKPRAISPARTFDPIAHARMKCRALVSISAGPLQFVAGDEVPASIVLDGVFQPGMQYEIVQE